MRALTLIFAMMASLAACADSDTPAVNAVVSPSVSYVEGKDYTLIEPAVRTSDSSKIEVVEAFWYGCSHCRTFDPLMHAWAEKQAADVEVVYLPAMWNDSMEAHARIFYAAQNLKLEDKIRQPMFEALKQNRSALTKLDEIAAFVNTVAGVDVETFKKQYSSFGVTSQVKKTSANLRSYKISGTPQMVVDGKYLVTGQSANGQDGMLKVVSYLVAKIRKEKG